MSASAVLIVVAVVSGSDGSRALAVGEPVGYLRPGDAGVIFYELTVGGKPRVIEVAPAKVVSVERDEATLELPAGHQARSGHLARFEVPGARLAAELAAARAAAEALRVELAAAREELARASPPATAAGADGARELQRLRALVDRLESDRERLRTEVEALVFTLGETLAAAPAGAAD